MSSTLPPESSLEFESALGNPSAQKILSLLVIWDKLSVKELASKSHVSESQIHYTLGNLKTIGLIVSESRGIYKLAESSFSEKLKDAYYTGLIQVVNAKISFISKLLHSGLIEDAKVNFSLLKIQYDPLLKKHFLFIIDSLSKQILDQLG